MSFQRYVRNLPRGTVQQAKKQTVVPTELRGIAVAGIARFRIRGEKCNTEEIRTLIK
jgi:hypothetical protein